MAAEDWDLYAVVGSCTNKTAATAAGNTATFAADVSCNNEPENPFACLSSPIFDGDDPFTFPNLEQPRNNAFDELNQLFKPFLSSAGAGDVNASVSDLREVKLESRHQQQKKQKVSENVSVTNSLLGAKQQTPCVQQREAHHRGIHEEAAGTSGGGSVVPFLALPPPPQISPRLRKRKSQQKRMVCEVAPENLSSDMWAWRKYGQKPIKGSPYPRNYYRCSSSKGCSARKQVEKSTTDPNIFVVTYTGDHSHPRPTHRNSLAGSTRNKLSHPSRAAGQDSDQPSGYPVCSSPLSPTTPLTSAVDRPAPKAEVEDEDDYVADIDDDVDGLLIPNRAVTEDFFMGVEEIMRYGGDSGFGQNLGFMGGLPGRKRKLESSWAAAAGSSAAAGAASGGGC